MAEQEILLNKQAEVRFVYVYDMTRNAMRNIVSEENVSSVLKGPRCWDPLDQVLTSI